MHLYLVSFSSPRTFKRSNIVKNFKLRRFFLNMAYLPGTPRLGAICRAASSCINALPTTSWRDHGFEQSDHSLSQVQLSQAEANNCDQLPWAISCYGELKNPSHIHEGKVITQASSRGFEIAIFNSWGQSCQSLGWCCSKNSREGIWGQSRSTSLPWGGEKALVYTYQLIYSLHSAPPVCQELHQLMTFHLPDAGLPLCSAFKPNPLRGSPEFLSSWVPWENSPGTWWRKVEARCMAAGRGGAAPPAGPRWTVHLPGWRGWSWLQFLDYELRGWEGKDNEEF